MRSFIFLNELFINNYRFIKVKTEAFKINACECMWAISKIYEQYDKSSTGYNNTHIYMWRISQNKLHQLKCVCDVKFSDSLGKNKDKWHITFLYGMWTDHSRKKQFKNK